MDNPKAPAVRILVVDDERLQQQALIDVLTLEGYTARGCDDSHQAIQKLQQGEFDLLITDLQMPGINGIDLIRQAQVINPELPAILVTGHASVESAVAAMRSGVFDYVTKPFRLSTMVAAVERALERHRLRKANAALQTEVKKQNEELKVINRELDTFAARLSHDLRGPIANMRGILAEVLNDDSLGLPEDLKMLLRAGVRSGDVALKMVRDLLDFARLGHKELSLTAVDLQQLVQLALPDLLVNHPRKDVEVTVEALPTVLGHEGLLHQVFTNLIGNALKYSKQSSPPKIKISSEFRPLENLWEISISDNGIGFNPELSHQLFRPFHRLENSSSFSGEGMGLATVKRIVERHGGSVGAIGNQGSGATFTIKLQPVTTS
jgi:signal transduction histidine kinase